MRLRNTLARFWPFLRPYPVQLALIGLSVIAAPALSTVTTWLFKVMIDDVIVPGSLREFWPVAAGFTVLAVVGGVVTFTEHYLTVWAGERFSLAIRSKLFEHLHDLPPDFLERRSLGDTASRVNGDIDVIESLLAQLCQALNHILLVCFFGVAIFILDWRLALASLIAFPCVVLLSRRFSKLVQVASREKSRRVGAVGSITEESLANAALVRAYGRGQIEHAKFVSQNWAGFEAHMASTRLQALFGPVTGLVQLTGTLLVFGLAVWEVGNGRITIGGLLAFIAYLGRMTFPIQEAGELVNSIFSANASAERVCELLDKQSSVQECANPTALSRATGAIRWHDVSFSYPSSGRRALANISFAVAPGERLAIVGASGAGKTTITKLLLRFYDPDHGSITIDGIDLRSLTFADLYRNISVVLQETLMFDGTIKENISWGKLDATAHEVELAARAADAHDFISESPNGYDTRVGQRGRLLSGGQRQRIAIARALIRDAPILILDEPTTGLDAETARRILTPMRRLMDGKAVITISHNLATVAAADKILFLHDGTLVGTGTHGHLMANSDHYAALYETHQESSPRSVDSG